MRAPQTFGSVLSETLSHFRLDAKAGDYEVLTRWPEIVGEAVAQSTTAEKLEKGILTVRVHSAAWRYELTLRSKEIVRKIAELCGDGLVKEIRWKS